MEQPAVFGRHFDVSRDVVVPLDRKLAAIVGTQKVFTDLVILVSMRVRREED